MVCSAQKPTLQANCGECRTFCQGFIAAFSRTAFQAPPCAPRGAPSKGLRGPLCRVPTRPEWHSFDRTSGLCAPRLAAREVVGRYFARYPTQKLPNWWKTIHRPALTPPKIGELAGSDRGSTTSPISQITHHRNFSAATNNFLSPHISATHDAHENAEKAIHFGYVAKSQQTI